jgi:hypothetical protein
MKSAAQAAPLFLVSYSALVESGIHSPRGVVPWDSGQDGPCGVRRAQVLDRPHLSFGKLPLPDKLAFSAASLLTAGTEPLDQERTAIVMGLQFGSLSTDLRYMESVASGFPSPAIFSATLPSSPVAEIAIFFRLKGPNRVLVQGPDSGLAAVDLASRLLALGKAENAVVVSATALEPADTGSALRGPEAPPPNAAFGLLLTRGACRGPLHYRLDIDLRPRRRDSRSGSSDVYFLSLVGLLDKQECGRVKIDTGGYGGSLNIEKDE